MLLCLELCLYLKGWAGTVGQLLQCQLSSAFTDLFVCQSVLCCGDVETEARSVSQSRSKAKWCDNVEDGVVRGLVAREVALQKRDVDGILEVVREYRWLKSMRRCGSFARAEIRRAHRLRPACGTEAKQC